MRVVMVGVMSAAAMWGQANFAGVMGGVSTLSGDALVQGSPPQRVSAYKPENGAGLLLFAGRHFGQYFSAQLSYGWNHNDVLLTGSDVASSASFDLPTRVTMHTVMAEAMVYFRRRDSRLRPYLSAGPGIVSTRREATGSAHVRGSPPLPSAKAEALQPALRVAVGIDWRVREHVALRYSFSETIQRNPISRSLIPAGERNLANFQNWWGIAWTF